MFDFLVSLCIIFLSSCSPFTDKPYFLSNPPPVLNIRNGTDAVLNCTVQGYPDPSAWWTTNATIDPARVVNTTTKQVLTGKTIIHTSLTIKNLGEMDFGLYTCHAVEGGNKTAASDTILKVSCKFILNNFYQFFSINFLIDF